MNNKYAKVTRNQIEQLERLQERREQIELMLEWEKSLSNFDNNVIEMIIDYTNSKLNHSH